MLESGSVAISTSARVGAARAPVAEHERERARAPQGRNRAQHPALARHQVSSCLADGTRLLSGSQDKTFKLWDAATGRLLRTFEGHSETVTSVAFSPDGTRLLSGSDDKTLKLWDAASGNLIRGWEAQRLGVTAVAFSPDGTHLLSAGSDPVGRMDNTLRLWDAASGQLVRIFGASATYTPDGTKWHGSVHEGHSNSVTSVAFSPDGTRLLSGSEDKTRQAVGRRHRAADPHLRGARREVKSVAFSPDGTRLLSGGRDDTLKLWDTASGQLIRTFEASSSVSSVAFSPDGTRVLSGGLAAPGCGMPLADS